LKFAASNWGQIPIKSHAFQRQRSPRVHECARPALPELRFIQHTCQQTIGALKGAQQASQKPP